MNRREFMWRSAAVAGAASGLQGFGKQNKSDSVYSESELRQGAALAVGIPPAQSQAGPAGIAGGGERPYYPSDDFDTPYLKRRWLIHDTDVKLADGRVMLTNTNSTTGGIQLKGCYDNRTASGQGGRPKVYLRWPWAMESLLTIPRQNRPETSFHSGIGLTLSNDQGLQALVQLGRLGGFDSNWVYYRVEGKREDNWLSDSRVNAAKRIYLRIEGVGNDGRSIRCGVRVRVEDPWIWSPAHQLSQAPTWAEAMGLFNASVAGNLGLEATGEPVTVAFDYVHFEGRCFSFEKRGPAGFIRPSLASPGAGQVRGRRYEAQVPDTLDLAERCALALNALTGCADPTADYEIYGMALTNPEGWTCYDLNYYNPDVETRLPVMVHDFGDDLLQAKVVEAIPLMRVASGSDLNLDAGEGMLQWLRRTIGEDGLGYHPVRGRPWALFAFSGVDPFGPQVRSGQLCDAIKSQYSGLMPGRLMLALGSWHAVTQDPALIADMKRMTDGLAKSDAPSWAKLSHPIGQGALVQGLAKCYKLTGYEPARELAGKLIQHFRTAYYGEDGTFKYSHFHTATFGLLAMAEFASATGDHDLLSLVGRGYEYGRTKGWPLVGFFPEGVGQRPATCESCETAEMAALAAKLSEARVGDYWDDVDQNMRNQFAENQLLHTDWITEMVRTDSHPPAARPNIDATRDVAKRLVGWFTSYGSASYWFMDFPRAPGTVACCLGNGSRALYYVWQSILTYVPGTLQVNLLLNRSSQWADVDSHIPYAGQVDVRMKEDLRLLVRIPHWVSEPQVKCRVNGQVTSLTWQGRYASPGPVKKGDLVTLTFPIAERTVRQQIGEEYCSLVVKGSTVVSIEPRGERYPYYQRAAYRDSKTHWKRAQRFVADQLLTW